MVIILAGGAVLVVVICGCVMIFSNKRAEKLCDAFLEQYDDELQAFEDLQERYAAFDIGWADIRQEFTRTIGGIQMTSTDPEQIFAAVWSKVYTYDELVEYEKKLEHRELLQHQLAQAYVDIHGAAYKLVQNKTADVLRIMNMLHVEYHDEFETSEDKMAHCEMTMADGSVYTVYLTMEVLNRAMWCCPYASSTDF